MIRMLKTLAYFFGMSNQPPPLKPAEIHNLINRFLNQDIDEEERNDIATALLYGDDPKIAEAFVKVANDPATPELLLEACGECLATIWLKRGSIDMEKLNQLQGTALDFAIGGIKNNSRDLFVN